MIATSETLYWPNGLAVIPQGCFISMTAFAAHVEASWINRRDSWTKTKYNCNENVAANVFIINYNRNASALLSIHILGNRSNEAI